MTGSKSQRRWQSMLIDARFQGRIVAVIVIAGFLSVVLTTYLYYAYVADSYRVIFSHANLPQAIVNERYGDLFQLWAALTVLNVAIILVVAIWSVIITHRAAGAVYHMTRVIAEFRAGNAQSRAHLREKDEFKGLANALNALLDETQKK